MPFSAAFRYSFSNSIFSNNAWAVPFCWIKYCHLNFQHLFPQVSYIRSSTWHWSPFYFAAFSAQHLFQLFFQLLSSPTLIDRLSTTHVPFEEITALPDIHSNPVLASSDAFVSFQIADISNYRKENSTNRTKSESLTIAIEPTIYDYSSTEILFNTSFTHARMGRGLLCSLFSSTALTAIILCGLGLLTFLTYLWMEREVKSVSECIEGLVLHFITRPNFQMVKLGMFWGRNQQTVELDT